MVYSLRYSCGRQSFSVKEVTCKCLVAFTSSLISLKDDGGPRQDLRQGLCFFIQSTFPIIDLLMGNGYKLAVNTAVGYCSTTKTS